MDLLENLKMPVGWEWVDNENARKNSLPTSDLVLPTTVIAPLVRRLLPCLIGQ